MSWKRTSVISWLRANYTLGIARLHDCTAPRIARGGIKHSPLVMFRWKNLWIFFDLGNILKTIEDLRTH